jgi:hypothetical protein
MKQPEEDYYTIDHNYARAVIGYCQYYKGYITARQAKVHRCHLKHGGACPRLQNLEGRSIRKVKTEQFYDKIVSRLDNLIGAVNKLTKVLEAMEKVEFNKAMTISVTDENGNPIVLHKHAESKDE